tara:strand:- start:250 stop:492 length:243 start_codon:yes stop_codon:yes gene_type:complete
MTIIKQIQQAAKEYDERLLIGTPFGSTNHRLTILISNHGIEKVSAASGLRISSLVQYGKKNAPKVAELTVKRAESVLSQF